MSTLCLSRVLHGDLIFRWPEGPIFGHRRLCCRRNPSCAEIEHCIGCQVAIDTPLQSGAFGSFPWALGFTMRGDCYTCATNLLLFLSQSAPAVWLWRGAAWKPFLSPQHRLDFVTGQVSDPTVLKEEATSSAPAAEATAEPPAVPTVSGNDKQQPADNADANGDGGKTNGADSHGKPPAAEEMDKKEEVVRLNNASGPRLPDRDGLRNRKAGAAQQQGAAPGAMPDLFSLLSGAGAMGGGMPGFPGPAAAAPAPARVSPLLEASNRSSSTRVGDGGCAKPARFPCALQHLDRAVTATGAARLLVAVLLAVCVFLLSIHSSGGGAAVPGMQYFEAFVLPVLRSSGLGTLLLRSPGQILVALYAAVIAVAFLAAAAGLIRTQGAAGASLPPLLNLIPGVAHYARVFLVGSKIMGSLLDCVAIYLVFLGVTLGLSRKETAATKDL